ncbi:division/cell wall cluster transcriptional repressor MraZ [Telmatospirillum sp.]|uniref:division/cell wall cluster transcriptional repressor MraZ n=1 Tax=Telmatospirillum sp. TaxID=2079197 RepID=UPI002851457B|nr:division/cell wall cluster transcriptional repressor MraZ [Telmatospirillum sp.]MDR3435782.1 division/cell wall cluster transcriptional repressor MraZ [Telmatospirillum sp.]
MALFVSTYINKVDRKGRVSVPAQFRAALNIPAQPVFVLYPSFTLSAIEGCNVDFLEKLADSTSTSFDLFSTEQEDINTLIFSVSHQLTCDPDGRVVLPEEIMAHANITEQAAFVGKGKTFQIWEPEALKAHTAAARARAMQNRPQISLRASPAAEEK